MPGRFFGRFVCLLSGLPCRCAAVIAALTLSACSLLPKPEAQQTYVLPAQNLPTATPAHAETALWSLRVQTPQAIAPLDSPRIIVQRPNASLASYRGIRWADRAPALLRDRLVQSLDDSGRFRTIVSGNTTLPADAELVSTLRAFQLDMPEDPDAGHARVAVRLDVQLITQAISQQHATGGPRLLAQHTFLQMHAVDDARDPDAVIAAFGRAVDALTTEIAHWLAQQTPPPDAGNTP